MMIKIMKIVVAAGFLLTIISACGVVEEQPQSVIEDTPTGNASGITLAGQEAPEIIGTLKQIDADEAIITVSGQDIQYRLSDVAKNQINNQEVDINQQVTFKTFSIGDQKETVAEFILE
ncbi:hypothetical protein QUF56_13680 [Ureibacillus composti]|nr:hypothetical protein [Ureibacillus composti]